MTMADIVNYPKMDDHDTLEDYKRVVLEFFGVSRLSLIGIYGVWKGIMKRCYCTKYDGYHRYGGRGITVCDRWRLTERDRHEGLLYFFNDMGPKPSNEKYLSGISIWSINRKDNNGNYEPDNCEWTTTVEQSLNREVEAKKYEYRGELYTMWQLVKLSGLSKSTLYSRLEINGWSVEDAVETPLFEPRLFMYKGSLCTAGQLSSVSGINDTTIRHRIEVLGMSVEEAMNTPVHEGVRLEYRGKTYSTSEFSVKFDINPNTVKYRLSVGMTPEEILSKPVRGHNSSPIVFQGISMLAADWFMWIGTHSINRETMSKRNRQGLVPSDILRPFSGRHPVTKLYPTIIITIDGISTEYKDIIDAAEDTSILLLDIVAELNKDDGYVVYRELRSDIDSPDYDSYTITHQDVTKTINGWYDILGKHSVSRYVMLERILEGLIGIDVLTPYIHDVVPPHPNYRPLDVAVVKDGKVAIYNNITECSHITNVSLDIIISVLEKDDGYIVYNNEQAKLDKLINNITM